MLKTKFGFPPHAHDLIVHVHLQSGAISAQLGVRRRNQSQSGIAISQSVAISRNRGSQSVNQPPSAAISRHQLPSVAISRNQSVLYIPDEGGNQSPSAAIRPHTHVLAHDRNQSPSVAISRHQPPSAAISHTHTYSRTVALHPIAISRMYPRMITIPIGPHPTGCDVGSAVSSTLVSPGAAHSSVRARYDAPDTTPGRAPSSVCVAAARHGAGTPPNQLVIRGTPARGDAMHTMPRT